MVKEKIFSVVGEGLLVNCIKKNHLLVIWPHQGIYIFVIIFDVKP